MDSILEVIKRLQAVSTQDEEEEWAQLLDCANSILARCKEARQLFSLETAVKLLRENFVKRLELDPNRLDQIKHLDRAVMIGFIQYCQTGNVIDDALSDEESVGVSSLNTAIDLYREALEETPDSKRLTCQYGLAVALGARFCHTGFYNDMDESLSLYRQAISTLDLKHPEPWLSLSFSAFFAPRVARSSHIGSCTTLRGIGEAIDMCNLVGDMLKNSVTSDRAPELDVAISLYRRMIQAPETNDHVLYWFSCVLEARYEQTGDSAYVDEAVSFHKQALKMRPDSHPLRWNSLNSLSMTLHRQFDQDGRVLLLEEAILLGREAVALRPDPNPQRSISLSNLAIVLATWFGQTNQIFDLEEAISLYRESLQHPPSTDGLSDTLDSLAIALHTRFNHSGQTSDLDEAILLHRRALELLPIPHRRRPNSLSNLASTLERRFIYFGQISDLDEAISLLREAVTLLPIYHVDRVFPLSNLAVALHTKFRYMGQGTDLEESLSLLQEALKLRPTSHPDYYSSLNDLASVFATRFSQTGQIADLEYAVSFHQQALDQISAIHPARSGLLNNLANTLQTRYNYCGQINDIDRAISFHRESLELRSAPHPSRPNSLNNLAISLGLRFGQIGQRVDLDESILLLQEALDLQPVLHPGRPMSLNSLASALHTRFSQSGQIADLDTAISLEKEALELLPEKHSERWTSLNNIAIALNARSGQTSQVTDLDEAILSYREALALLPMTHPEKSRSLGNLGNSLNRRFTQTGRIADLDEAILLHQKALELQPIPHPGRPNSLSNLAVSLNIRFDHSGDIADLNEAISLNREALELLPRTHPHRSNLLGGLATVLHMRFTWTGQIEDLEEAISLERNILQLRPGNHPGRPISINNLAKSLEGRFNYSGQMHDLDEAISLFRTALELCPPPHSDRSLILSNIAFALVARADIASDVDLDEAITLHREALDLKPDSYPGRAGSLSGLASALHMRSMQPDGLKRLSLLDEAILLDREALSLFSPRSPDLPTTYHNLSSIFRTRYVYTGLLPDVKESIAASTKALQLLPEDHAHRCKFSLNLGHEYMDMYTHTHETRYLEDAIATFRAAATYRSASASERFRCARVWARYVDNIHETALEAYEIALKLLPDLTMLGLDLQARRQVLMLQSHGLARDAAACAIRLHQLDKAVEFLEQGRAVFWSQALQLRTPLDDLKSVNGNLAKRLQDLAHALDMGSFRSNISLNRQTESPEIVVSIEQEAIHFRRLNDDWLATLEEIRQLDGFQDFLLPKSWTELLRCAVNGPVVLLNASESNCDALILNPSEINHVPLPNFNFQIAKSLIQHIHAIPNSSYRGPSSESESNDRFLKRVKQTTSEDQFRSVLGTLWKSVVWPVIRSLNLEKSDSPPRLWWCPTGLFSFLPVHAAGMYDQGASNDSIFHYVVSSYTPTLSTLLLPPPKTTNRDNIKMMVVIQPSTPGYPPLPQTQYELDRITEHVPDQSLIKLGIPSAPALTDSVLFHLSSASIVHFACHGQQNADNPLESAIILADSSLKVSRIMQHPTPNAKLVFLSACQTAMGDTNLPDEVIHIAGTLIFAGFHGAVATMWSIADIDGPNVSDGFYNELFHPSDDLSGSKSDFLDTTRAARALHLAVSKIRNEGVPFVRWVPFIHLGL